MSYQVLARKFRPATFDEVVGQDPVVRTLRNAIEGGRIAHAYLFSGARGVGKTTLARILAKCLNCREGGGPRLEPCGACESCLEIAESTSLDVQEIDGASNRGIDDIRELRETSRYQPTRDRHRIFIIDEVHMLTREAFNALLKTLEEPPPHVVFVFATTEYQKVPATITSRCQHFEFRRIERGTLAATLSAVAKKEGLTLGERGADLLARTADGSLRDALGYLDQAAAYCGDDVTDDGLREILGVAGLEAVDGFFDAVAARDSGTLLGLIDRLARGGQDLAHFCRELVERSRELLLLRTVKDAAAVLGMTDSEEKEARARAESFSPEDLLRLGTALTELEGKLRFSIHPRFLLEMAAIRLARTSSVVPIGDLIARVEAIGGSGGAPPRGSASGNAPSGGGSSGGTARESAGSPSTAPPVLESAAASMQGRRAVPPMEQPPHPAGVTASAGGPAPMDRDEPPHPAEIADLRPASPADPEPAPSMPADSKEEEIRRRVAVKRSALASYLEHATTFQIDKENLVIRFPSRHALFKNGLARADNRALLEEAVEEAIGRKLSIDVGISEDGDPEMASLARAEHKAQRRDALMNEALSEPIVRSLMDRFGASVVRIEEAGNP